MEKIMGLEKVVLNVIEDADGEIADSAAFYCGTLFLRGAAHVPGIRLYRVVNAIKTIVNCELQINEAGDDIAIDFV
jgi:hypothetical protein